jgi:catechol 2,3-dioxygenase-like lactoylglutathione lyase family enzyme
MNLQKIYTALFTADLAAAEDWYTKLLGRGPDNRPMDTLVQWELFDQGGVALSTDDEIAGRGVVFLIVDDVAAERRRLRGLGSVLGDDIEGTTRRWRRCVILTATSHAGDAALAALSAGMTAPRPFATTPTRWYRAVSR